MCQGQNWGLQWEQEGVTRFAGGEDLSGRTEQPSGNRPEGPRAQLGRKERESRRTAAHPTARDPRAISPCSAPRRATSSTGRNTFILDEAGAWSGVSQSQRCWSCLENTHWRTALPPRIPLLPVGAQLPLFHSWRGVGPGLGSSTACTYRGPSAPPPNLPLAGGTLLLGRPLPKPVVPAVGAG